MPDRVASGTLFSSGEYHEFYDRCLLKGDPQKTGVIDFKYFESKQLRNAMVASQRSMAKASNGTVQGRIRRFRCFLEWLYRQAHDSFDVAGDVKERYLRLTAEIKLNEKRLGKNENRHVASPSMSVIPDSTFIKLLSVTHPSSPKISKTLGFHISPHTLRHKWNEIFDISGNKCGIDASRLEDVRKYAMGWTQSSSMSTIYNDKRLAVVAREISKAHQQRIDLLK